MTTAVIMPLDCELPKLPEFPPGGLLCRGMGFDAEAEAASRAFLGTQGSLSWNLVSVYAFSLLSSCAWCVC